MNPRNSKTLSRVAVLLTSFFCGVVNAAPVTFDIVFHNSTYEVDSGDSFHDLVDAHNDGSLISSTSVTTFEGVDTSLYAGSISGDYSVMMTTTLNIAVAGDYHFQVGADWGGGGGVALTDTGSGTILNEYVTDENIWWGYNWNHGDVISTSYNLGVGSYTLTWLGFEDCCAGSSDVRFAYGTGAYQALNLTNITPYVVPVPASVWLFGSTLVAMAGWRRRRDSRAVV